MDMDTNPLKLFSKLLNFPGTEVIKISENISGNEITLKVKSTKETVDCRICEQPTNGHGLGRHLTLRHLSLLGKRTFIEIKPRRGICRHCKDGPTTTEVLDWYKVNSKQTKAYEQHLLFQLVNSTVADVSAKESVDYHVVESLIDRMIETEIDYSTISSFDVLGLDEISLKKGYQDFVTLVTYRRNEVVAILGVIKGRNKTDVIDFLRGIPNRLKKTVTAICCDLYDGYISACKKVFKKTPVVADRFHVRRLYQRSLIQLRKSELKRLRKSLSSTEYAQLKSAITLCRKQKDYFSDEEKVVIEILFKHSPKLKCAYHLSRQLSGIFDSHITREQANEKMSDWTASVVESELTCFDHFIKTLLNYQEEILNYFIARHNSGFVEGFNNRVKVLKRRCYGLSNVARLFQRIIIDTLGINRFAPDVVAF